MLLYMSNYGRLGSIAADQSVKSKSTVICSVRRLAGFKFNVDELSGAMSWNASPDKDIYAILAGVIIWIEVAALAIEARRTIASMFYIIFVCISVFLICFFNF